MINYMKNQYNMKGQGENMRTEIKEIQRVEKVTRYISDDGKTFEREEDCKAWEKSYKGTIWISVGKIPHIETNGEDAYLPAGVFDDEVWILKPRDFEDIKVINSLMYDILGSSNKLTHEDIGKLIALNFGYEREWGGIYRLNNHLKTIHDTYANLSDKIDSMMENTEK